MTFFKRFSTRSIVVLLGVVGAFYLAVIDPSLRKEAMALSLGIVTGYFGQLQPAKKEEEQLNGNTSEPSGETDSRNSDI